MTCEEMRNFLLEASVDEVAAAMETRGTREYAHLRECAGCSALAERLADGFGQLAAEYRSLSSGFDADAAALSLVATAHGTTGRSDIASSSVTSSNLARRHPNGAGRRRTRYEFAATLLALSVAAVLLLLLSRPAAEQGANIATDEDFSSPVAVEVGENQNAIIFETRDPKITVVWLYSSGN
jgi:hypothetical protein